MGKGNPESADAFIARESNIFVADKLSDKNKSQLSSLDVHWVELRSEEGFLRFENILKDYNISYVKPDPKDIDKKVDYILNDKPVSESNSSDAYNAMELVHRCYQDSGFPTYKKMKN